MARRPYYGDDPWERDLLGMFKLGGGSIGPGDRITGKGPGSKRLDTYQVESVQADPRQDGWLVVTGRKVTKAGKVQALGQHVVVASTVQKVEAPGEGTPEPQVNQAERQALAQHQERHVPEPQRRPSKEEREKDTELISPEGVTNLTRPGKMPRPGAGERVRDASGREGEVVSLHISGDYRVRFDEGSGEAPEREVDFSVGQVVQIRRYGKTYNATVMQETPTRVLLKWTYANGQTRETWVEKGELRR